jgi:DNA-binding PadR family transcriptional regulator
MFSIYVYLIWYNSLLLNVFSILIGSGGNLEEILQKLHKKSLVPHRGRLEKKYYEIVQEGSLEGKK